LKRRIVSGEYTDEELANIYIEWVNEISDNLFSDDDSKDKIRNFWKSESYRNFDNKEEESGIFFCFAAYLDDIG
jgi:homoserine trans-succinylase